LRKKGDFSLCLKNQENKKQIAGICVIAYSIVLGFFWMKKMQIGTIKSYKPLD